MKKALFLSLLITFLTLTLGGCAKQTAEYSNLADETSRAEVASVLEECQLPEEQTETLLKMDKRF